MFLKYMFGKIASSNIFSWRLERSRLLFRASLHHFLQRADDLICFFQQFCSSNLVSRHHGKEGAQRESAKEKPKTGPYRTSRCSLCSAVMEEFLAFRFANRTRKKYVK